MLNIFKKLRPEISEPVFSFLKLLKDEPKRFILYTQFYPEIRKARCLYKPGKNIEFYSYSYILLDRKERQIFKFKITMDFAGSLYFYPLSENISFLTEDEKLYLADYFRIWNKLELDKMKNIKRQEMVKIYGEVKC